jgi:feruloyl esterase
MRKCALALIGVGAFSSAAFGQTATDGRQACANLSKLAVAQTEIVETAVVEAGAFDSHEEHPNPIYKALPAFCRVAAVARPTADSDIKIEVWLPLTGWNGKFQGVGNGGFAGSIGYAGLAIAVLTGSAGGGTDTGHTGGAGDSAWALGHPEKIVDFGWRGVHTMTDLSKTVVQAFYSAPVRRSYFSSCSDGGREALMEAQRFPADYDGILAGAPAYNWTSLVSHSALLAKELDSSAESYLPASKIPAINAAVLKACQKGEPGAFLADPQACRFSPETMICKDAVTDACLTPTQAASLKAIYASAYLKDGTLVYHGQLPGGESGAGGWTVWITGPMPGASADAGLSQGYFRNLVYSDPKWDPKSFDLDRDLKAAQQKTSAALDAVNPDLTAFKARGGKLILYHGWNDPAISPLATVDYVNSVGQKMGQQQAQEFVRLFLVPGMQHCTGGPGPSDFGQWGHFNPVVDNAANNMTIALEDWVEKGTAPEQIIARGNTDPSGKGNGAAFAQPICAYPKVATYKGTGDGKEASSYTCEESLGATGKQ